MKPWYELSGFMHGIPVSRYIVSWYQAGGGDDIHKIREWLKSLVINGKKLNEDEIKELSWCMVEGKLELEESAKKFV